MAQKNLTYNSTVLPEMLTVDEIRRGLIDLLDKINQQAARISDLEQKVVELNASK